MATTTAAATSSLPYTDRVWKSKPDELYKADDNGFNEEWGGYFMHQRTLTALSADEIRNVSG